MPCIVLAARICTRVEAAKSKCGKNRQLEKKKSGNFSAQTTHKLRKRHLISVAADSYVAAKARHQTRDIRKPETDLSFATSPDTPTEATPSD